MQGKEVKHMLKQGIEKNKNNFYKLDYSAPFPGIHIKTQYILVLHYMQITWIHSCIKVCVTKYKFKTVSAHCMTTYI